MIVPDVNILVGAIRVDAAHHDRLAPWLDDAVADPEPLGVSDLVLGEVLRITTHPKIFAEPSTTPDIVGILDELLSTDGVVRLSPGPRHWSVFTELCRAGDARGALVADAQHAAVAVEHGATWVTLDRDFARFPGLRWRTPWD